MWGKPHKRIPRMGTPRHTWVHCGFPHIPCNARYGGMPFLVVLVGFPPVVSLLRSLTGWGGVIGSLVLMSCSRIHAQFELQQCLRISTMQNDKNIKIAGAKVTVTPLPLSKICTGPTGPAVVQYMRPCILDKPNPIYSG